VAILSEELLKIVPMIPHRALGARHLEVGWSDPPATPHLQRAAFHVKNLGCFGGTEDAKHWFGPKVSKLFSKSSHRMQQLAQRRKIPISTHQFSKGSVVYKT
jgi:hypothetical protein